ncbi:branched-chain amino acid ABC transporter permease [Lentzea nigeriaca]|uniref:branched-chain amino acid ABC transporter permease n=1 Tax=Lentzea nigeriaca TaxID=1128665 RepID=UPI00195CF450|nr:branched-chain amino acid ABC transporter permease [Lentzea nigeriaca]MBM7863623.1 branched-chain amino acid transport system permease protein [Lentzea nigeriaca]
MRKWLLWGVVAVAGIALPYILDDYQTFQIARVTTTALPIASLVLLTGWSGQVSAGQGALFGLGAYTCAIAIVSGGLPWPVAVLLAMVVGLAAGLLLGLPALRLSGMSLGLITLSLAVLFPLLLSRFKDLTGGPFGIQTPPVRTPAGIQLSSAQFLYLVTFVALAAVFALLALLCRGRTGRALDALRLQPAMARTTGVDTRRLSVLVVGMSGAVAALGGALNALVLQSVVPDAYAFTFSLALLTGAVIGGIRSWAGALVGAVFVVYVPQLVSDTVGDTLAGHWTQVGYALVLLLTLYFAPQGLAGLGSRITTKIGERRAHQNFAP